MGDTLSIEAILRAKEILEAADVPEPSRPLLLSQREIVAFGFDGLSDRELAGRGVARRDMAYPAQEWETNEVMKTNG